MNTALSIAVVVGISLLGFQAISLLVTGHETQRWTAALTAAIAAMISLNLYLTCQVLLVVDLADGLLLTQGASQWLLRALVFGYPFVATMVVQSAAAPRDPLHRPLLTLLTGLAVSAYSAYGVSQQGRDDLPSATIYAYELFSPWPLLWVSGCVLDWGLLVGGLRQRDFRRWFSVTACLGVAGLVSAFARDRDLASQWTLAYWVTFGFAILFGLRVCLQLLLPRFYEQRVILRRALLGLLLAGLLVPVAIYHHEVREQGEYVGASCCGLVLIALVWVGRRALQREQLFLKDEGKLVRYVLGFSLLTLLLLSFDLLLFQLMPSRWNLLGSSIAAIVLVELAAEGPLLNVGAATTLWGEASVVRIVLLRCIAGVRWAAHRVWRAVRWVQALPWVPRLVLQVVVPLVVYGAVDALPDADRTVVQTFDVYGARGESDVGERFSQLVVNRLNGIALDLDENMLIAVPAALQGAAAEQGGGLQQAAVHTSSVEADLGSHTLDLGSLGKVRLDKVLALLQRPLRHLLNTRYIEGALIEEGEGYRVLARSSTGQSWTYPHAHDKPVDLLTLARLLSFDILSTDTDWTERGMTLDAEAFEAFLDSTWSQLKQERLGGNAGTLRQVDDTIEHLRQAVAVDPSFAVAHYRLALALSRQAQYGGALDHLRAALRARPNFGPARAALARLLQDGLYSDRPLLLRAMHASAADPARDTRTQNLREEARELWTAMIRPRSSEWLERDRAAAHLGLCSLALSQAEDDAHLEGVFNCSAASQLYATVAEGELDAQDRNALLAYTFNALGVLRTRHVDVPPDQAETLTFVEADWGCSAGQFDGWAWTLQQGGDAESTRLFRLAHELTPSDTTIACNLAVAEYTQGDHARFSRLESDPETQRSLCGALLEEAVDLRSASHFRAALKACDRALEGDPLNTDALNLYAYAFRIWWYTLPGLDAAERASGEVAERAERRARMAVQLAQSSAVEGYRGTVESTLGEVLLALGRPHEALSWLTKASEHVPKHASFTEVHRDLAEALVCVRREDSGRTDRAHGDDCRDALERADTILSEIRAREGLLETNVYAAEDEGLSREQMATRCDRALRVLPQADEASQVQAAVKYPTSTKCGTKVLRVKAPPELQASVRVWGNGSAATGEASNFTHALDPEPTHGQYLAQLIDAQGKPLSDRYWLDTLKPSDPSCRDADGVLDVIFSLRRSTPGATAAARPPVQ